MKTLLAFSLLMTATSLAAAKPPADLQHRLDELLKGQPGGAAVAWVDADGTAFFQTGHFDGDASPAITPDTRFELGSITKVFTALLLAESERLGKVNRSDPAAKYLLPADDPTQAALAGITLLSLTTHTSGLIRLSSNIGLNPDANPDPYAKFDRTMLVDALRHDGLAARQIGNVAYSNFGVSVLGEALASAWGTSYSDALRSHVLDPLGMNVTTLGLAGLPPPPNFPPGHVHDRTVPTWTFQAYAPAGALRSSARDMVHLLTACLGQGDSPLHAALDATFAPQYRVYDPNGQIGLGWFIADGGLIWHAGATAGSHAFVGFNRQAGTGVVILANTQVALEPLGFGLLGAKLPPARAQSVKDAASYVGRYPLTSDFAIDITERNGTLQGQATRQPPFILQAIAADRFAIAGIPAEISFERDMDGRVTALVLHQNGREQRGPRGESPPPPKEVTLPVETLREYVGDYPLSPRFIITVSETDGALFAQATGQGKAPLFASAKDEFFYKVVNAQISFQRDSAGKVTSLVLHQNGRDAPAQKTK